MVSRKHFQRFENILKSAGFTTRWLYRSKYTINAAYSAYLILQDKGLPGGKIEKFIRRFFVLSILTGRYMGSPEAQLEYDLKRLSTTPLEFLEELEKVKLTDEFFNLELPKRFLVSISGYNHPIYLLYLAALVKNGANAFLSSNIKVVDIIGAEHDLHHIFPKAYLAKYGYSKNEYNMLANVVIAQTEVNLQIRDKSPKEYFEIVNEQIKTKQIKIGSITDKIDLLKNLRDLAIPENIQQMTHEQYSDFIEARSKQMAQLIKEYYWGL